VVTASIHLFVITMVSLLVPLLQFVIELTFSILLGLTFFLQVLRRLLGYSDLIIKSISQKLAKASFFETNKRNATDNSEDLQLYTVVP